MIKRTWFDSRYWRDSGGRDDDGRVETSNQEFNSIWTYNLPWTTERINTSEWVLLQIIHPCMRNKKREFCVSVELHLKGGEFLMLINLPYSHNSKENRIFEITNLNFIPIQVETLFTLLDSRPRPPFYNSFQQRRTCLLLFLIIIQLPNFLFICPTLLRPFLSTN